MNTDRELLQLAAKAAGLRPGHGHGEYAWHHGLECLSTLDEKHREQPWNPLDDDGDALRLAVTCGLVVDTSRPSAGEPLKQHWCGQEDFADRGAATRRAIVRAAAAMAS